MRRMILSAIVAGAMAPPCSAASVAADAGAASPQTQAAVGIADKDLQFLLDTMDEAHVVLLDMQFVGNDPEWRTHYSGQVLGFGVRTQPEPVSAGDLAEIKRLLSDTANWPGGIKMCLIEGDAAILMRGPYGELTVMLELWCGRAYVRTTSAVFCKEAHGNIDPITKDLRGLFARYFPQDEHIGQLLSDDK